MRPVMDMLDVNVVYRLMQKRCYSEHERRLLYQSVSCVAESVGERVFDSHWVDGASEILCSMGVNCLFGGWF